MLNRAVVAIAVASVLMLSPEPALAASSVSTPPYSGDWAAWGCPGCGGQAGLTWETQESASRINGAISTSAKLSAAALSTGGGTLQSIGGLYHYLYQGKPVSAATVTIDYEITSATTGRSSTEATKASVRLVGSVWNANCGCEAKGSLDVAESGGTQTPASFSGPKSLTIRLAPGTPIKGTVRIDTNLLSEATLDKVPVTAAVSQRSGNAAANVVVKRMTFSS